MYKDRLLADHKSDPNYKKFAVSHWDVSIYLVVYGNIEYSRDMNSVERFVFTIKLVVVKKEETK